MLTKEQVKHIAYLARLGLTEAELEKYASDLSRILGYVSELQEVDTGEVEPIAHITGLENAYREDDPDGPALKSKAEFLIDQFPQKSNHYLKVPPVLDQQ